MKKFIVVFILALVFSNSAFAESCTTYIRGMFDGFPGDHYGAGDWFDVAGARISARGHDGFSSFTMASSYSPSQGVSTNASSARQHFFIFGNNGGNVIAGNFKDVFPGRKDGNADSTTLRITRGGSVELKLNSWNSSYFLSDLECYRGHLGSTFVLTGQQRSSSHGLNVWTFVITPNWLI